MTTIPPTPSVTIQLNRAAIDALFVADPTCVPKLAAAVVDHVAREHMSPFILQHPTMAAFRKQYADTAVKLALDGVGSHTSDWQGVKFKFHPDIEKKMREIATSMISQIVIDLVAKALGPDLSITVQNRIDVEISRAISNHLSSRITEAVEKITKGSN